MTDDLLVMDMNPNKVLGNKSAVNLALHCRLMISHVPWEKFMVSSLTVIIEHA